jgi:hypothetical protein
MQGVIGWFSRSGEVPLVPPPRVREYAPIDDDPDGDHDFANRAIRGAAFTLEYCDSRGWASTRTVRCIAVDPVHPACLRAFCHVRQEERTFRIDRIISIAELRTGRIVSSDEMEALLAPGLPAGQTDPDIVTLIDVQAATHDGVHALLQLAMPQGRLSSLVRGIVLDYVRAEARARHAALPRRYLDLWIDNLAPTLDMVRLSVANLLEDKDKFARLLPFLLKVARAQDPLRAHEDSLRELIAEVRRHIERKPLTWSRDLRATPGRAG